MGLIDDLTRHTGELIKAADWNTLVTAVENARIALENRVAKVETDLAALSAKVETDLAALSATVQAGLGDLTTQLNALTGRVNGLLGQYSRIALRTTQLTYALGTTAEIVAQVTDLEGRPLAGPTRPWVDFIASWGRFSPLAGYDSRGGATDRTISVRADADGIARVRLRPENTQNVAEGVELEMAEFMNTRPQGSTQAISQLVLQSNTPTEARPAYQVMSLAYSQKANTAVRNYADGYYQWKARGVDATSIGDVAARWRDYRSTVLASVTSDADPTTPDPSRGLACIQVTFRDWLWPWIQMGYLVEIAPVVTEVKGDFEAKITPDYRQSARQVSRAFEDLLKDRGLIERELYYEAAQRALDLVNPPEHPGFLTDLTGVFKQSIGVQRALERGNPAWVAAVGPEAFVAIADTSTRADAGFSEVVGRVDTLQGHVQAHAAGLLEVGKLVGELGGSVQALAPLPSGLAGVAQAVSALRDDLNGANRVAAELRNGLTGLDGRVNTQGGELSEKFMGLKDQFTEVQRTVREAGTRVDHIKSSVDSLGGRVDEVMSPTGPLRTLDAEVQTLRGQFSPFQGLNVADVHGKLGLLTGFDARIVELERRPR